MSASEMMMLEEELNELRTEVEKLRAERDHFREAWAAAQARLDCGVDSAEAVREERAAVVAWLHRMERNARHWGGKDDERADIYARLADVFECGEHRKEEES